MYFTKLQAHGNDFIVIASEEVADVDDLGNLARKMCDRHFGAGADGIVVVALDRSDDAECSTRIFNADGGEAEVSGNGTRCVAAWLDATGAWPPERDEVRIATKAGVKSVRRAGNCRYEADMGVPRFASDSIPMSLVPRREKVVRHPIRIHGAPVEVTAVSVGNPHCSVFVEDLAETDTVSVGRALEVCDEFPERTNVEFVQVLARDRIRVRFWERGVGTTLSSGTGSCAASVAAALAGYVDRDVTVETDSGSLHVTWAVEDDRLHLTGTAVSVYAGNWFTGE